MKTFTASEIDAAVLHMRFVANGSPSTYADMLTYLSATLNKVMEAHDCLMREEEKLLCCSGRMCGCYGTTNHERAEYVIEQTRGEFYGVSNDKNGV